MRAIIETFDNSDGTATAAIARIYDDNGRVINTHQTKFYREYPRAVRAFSSAESTLKIYFRKRLMTCPIERA